MPKFFIRNFSSLILLSTILVFTGRSYGAAALSIDGNDHLSKKKIEAALIIPDKPEELTSDDWDSWAEDAISALSDLYGEIGYFDVAVKVEAGQDTVKNAVAGFHILVHVKEGARYKFGAVDLVTADQSPARIDKGDLKCRTGRFFEKDFLFRDRRSIIDEYGNAGFLHAKSTESIVTDTAGKLINIKFLIEPGPAVIFDTLIIRNTRENDSSGAPGVTENGLLGDLLKLRTGDTVSLEKTGDFEKKLKSTRVFNYVRLRDSLIESKGNRSALILSTEEKIPGDMDLSGFYETQYGAGVSANWTHGNMQGKLHEGRLGASWAQRKQSLYLGYSSPLFYGTSLRFDNDLVTNWYQDSPLQSGTGSYSGDFDIINSSKVSRAFTVWSRYVGTTELTGQSEKIDQTTRDRAFNLNFINSMFFSFLDDAVNPARGTRWSFTWGNGGTFLEEGRLQVPTHQRHNWLEGESAYYWPLAERLKLAFRLDGGRFYGDGGLNSERFFLGGPRSVRSYGWRKVCPEVDTASGVCVKLGLEPAYFLTSFEIRAAPFAPSFISPEGRWKHLLPLQVVPFVDYGNIWEVGKPLTPEGKGRAFGIGLRYSLLSIFNVRLDYAVDGLEIKHDQWILDLAQAF